MQAINKTTGQKTADCTVRHDVDWMEVTSPSGTTVRIDVIDYANTWDAFTPEETDLFDRIMSKPSGSRLLLTYGEMQLFANVAARAEKDDEPAKVEEPTVETIPTGTPYTPAPGDVEIVAIEPIREPESKPVETQAVAPAAPAVQVEEYVLLIYDIPENSPVENPSGFLRRFAVRWNLSCWCVRLSQLHRAAVLFEEWDANGIEYHIVPFAPRAAKKISRLAQMAFERETARIHGSLIATIGSASDQFKAAVLAADNLTLRERERKESYRDSRIRRALKVAGEQLNAAIECAIVFDETMRVEHLFDSLRQAIAAQAIAFEARQFATV